MDREKRVYNPLGVDDLERLRELALEEHENFFERNPHLREAFYNSLIGICLCQGAASHYLNPTVGIKDFDIWHFYLESGKDNFPYRAHKRLKNGYKGKPIDFLKRSIPKYIYELTPHCQLSVRKEYSNKKTAAEERYYRSLPR